MALVTTFLWMWGSGYHFLSSRNTGFHQLQHEADTHLSIDFLVTVMVGVFTIMFPIEAVKLVTNDPDEVSFCKTVHYKPLRWYDTKANIRRLCWGEGGGGVSLISYFSTDKTLGTGYDIYL